MQDEQRFERNEKDFSDVRAELRLVIFGDGNGNKGLVRKVDELMTWKDSLERQAEKSSSRRTAVEMVILAAVLTLAGTAVYDHVKPQQVIYVEHKSVQSDYPDGESVRSTDDSETKGRSK